MNSITVIISAPIRYLTGAGDAANASFIKYIITRQKPPVKVIVQCVYPLKAISRKVYTTAPTAKAVPYSIVLNSQPFPLWNFIYKITIKYSFPSGWIYSFQLLIFYHERIFISKYKSNYSRLQRNRK